jgi:hypothetical protein
MKCGFGFGRTEYDTTLRVSPVRWGKNSKRLLKKAGRIEYHLPQSLPSFKKAKNNNEPPIPIVPRHHRHGPEPRPHNRESHELSRQFPASEMRPQGLP